MQGSPSDPSSKPRLVCPQCDSPVDTMTGKCRSCGVSLDGVSTIDQADSDYDASSIEVLEGLADKA